MSTKTTSQNLIVTITIFLQFWDFIWNFPHLYTKGDAGPPLSITSDLEKKVENNL